MPLDVAALQSRARLNEMSVFDEWRAQRAAIAMAPQVERATTDTFLDVPHREKDRAKSSGAVWDARKSRWYAPRNTDLTPLQRWREECRVYLENGIDMNATVKGLGGRWDQTAGKWYITTDMDRDPFNEWLMTRDE